MNPYEIVTFKNHTFQVKNDEDMYELRQSVKEHGILEPGIVFVNEEGSFELVSGHRRRQVSMDLGLETIPVLVKNITRDDAIIIMGETNLQRRSDILPSEKAFTYKMMLDAMKRQGKREDLTSCPEGTKLGRRSDDELSKKVNESVRQIHRYIRLTYLDERLLKLVDEKRIGLKPGVELSYLDSSFQACIWGFYEEYEVTPSHAQAIRIRNLAKEGLLDEEEIIKILSEEKPNQKEGFKISYDIVSRFLGECGDKASMENRIIKALMLLEKQEKINGRTRENANYEIER